MKRVICFMVLLCAVFGMSVPQACADDDLTKLPNATDGVIDLSGKTYTLSAAYTLSTGEVTIKNGVITFSSTVDAINVSGSGTKLTLGEGLTISGANGTIYVHNGGIITVDGATISQTTQTYVPACVGNYDNSDNADAVGTLIIKSG